MFISTLILTVSSTLSRLIGALYKIPLNRRLPAHILGAWSYAFPIFGLLYSLSSLGLPAAMLKLSAERMALKDGKSVLRIFLICFSLLGLSSFGFSALLYGAADLLAELFHRPGSGPVLQAMAPALFFSVEVSVLRAFFQSIDKMVVHGASVVLEQGLKAAAAIGFTGALLTAGDRPLLLSLGFSVTVGSGLGFFFLLGAFCFYTVCRRDLFRTQGTPLSYRRCMGELQRLSRPLMFGSLILPLFSNLELTLLNHLMLSVPGMTATLSQAAYAHYSARAATLTGLPQVLSGSLSASLMPAIAKRNARGHRLSLSSTCREALAVSLFAGLLAAGVFIGFREEIFALLYHSREGAGYLVPLACIMVLSMVRETQNGILQGLGRMDIPVRNQSLASVTRMLLMLLFIPRYGMMGYGWAGVLSTLLACVLACRAVRGLLAEKAGILGLVLSFLPGAAVFLWLPGLLPADTPGALMGCLCLGVGVYGSLALLSPGGRVLLDFFHKKRPPAVDGRRV